METVWVNATTPIIMASFKYLEKTRDRSGGRKDGKLEYNKAHIMSNTLINAYWTLIAY